MPPLLYLCYVDCTTPLSQNLTVRWHYLLPPLKIAKSPWNLYLCNACMQIQDSNTSR